MIRGTTPTLEFTLPFDTSSLNDAYITFAQNRKVIVSKKMSECACNANKLTVKLTQTETLKFSHSFEVEMQIRAKTKAGDVLASDIMHVKTGCILLDGEI